MSTNRSLIVLAPSFTPSFEQYCHSIRYDALDDAQDDADIVFEAAIQRLQPRVFIREMFIDRHFYVQEVPAVEIDSRQFVGKALHILQTIHRVFPYVVTCGNEMEQFDLERLDFLAPYWLDAIKNQALGTARKALIAYCKETLGISRPSSVNPGSGNVDIWPIEQMGTLFSLLDDTVYDYVRLTESSLMIPNKSIAGLMFAPTDENYESCAHCERPNCPSRRVPFEKRL